MPFIWAASVDRLFEWLVFIVYLIGQWVSSFSNDKHIFIVKRYVFVDYLKKKYFTSY